MGCLCSGWKVKQVFTGWSISISSWIDCVHRALSNVRIFDTLSNVYLVFSANFAYIEFACLITKPHQTFLFLEMFPYLLCVCLISRKRTKYTGKNLRSSPTFRQHAAAPSVNRENALRTYDTAWPSKHSLIRTEHLVFLLHVRLIVQFDALVSVFYSITFTEQAAEKCAWTFYVVSTQGNGLQPSHQREETVYSYSNLINFWKWQVIINCAILTHTKKDTMS